MNNLVVAPIVLMLGCASHQIKKGDFTPALLAQLANYGASIPTVGDLPHIETRWEINTDRHGFVVTLPAEHFQEIDMLLRHLYGAPSLWDERNLEGQPQGVFGADQAGVVIQYLRSGPDMRVICIKKLGKNR